MHWLNGTQVTWLRHVMDCSRDHVLELRSNEKGNTSGGLCAFSHDFSWWLRSIWWILDLMMWMFELMNWKCMNQQLPYLDDCFNGWPFISQRFWGAPGYCPDSWPAITSSPRGELPIYSLDLSTAPETIEKRHIKADPISDVPVRGRLSQSASQSSFVKNHK